MNTSKNLKFRPVCFSVVLLFAALILPFEGARAALQYAVTADSGTFGSGNLTVVEKGYLCATSTACALLAAKDNHGVMRIFQTENPATVSKTGERLTYVSGSGSGTVNVTDPSSTLTSSAPSGVCEHSECTLTPSSVTENNVVSGYTSYQCFSNSSTPPATVVSCVHNVSCGTGTLYAYNCIEVAGATQLDCDVANSWTGTPPGTCPSGTPIDISWSII
jgi:hypothetical protein